MRAKQIIGKAVTWLFFLAAFGYFAFQISRIFIDYPFIFY